MANIDMSNPKAAAGAVRSITAQILNGKKSVSRQFGIMALNIPLVSTEEAAESLNTTEKRVKKVLLQTGSDDEIKSFVRLVHERAEAFCRPS